MNCNRHDTAGVCGATARVRAHRWGLHDARHDACIGGPSGEPMCAPASCTACFRPRRSVHPAQTHPRVSDQRGHQPLSKHAPAVVIDSRRHRLLRLHRRGRRVASVPESGTTVSKLDLTASGNICIALEICPPQLHMPHVAVEDSAEFARTFHVDDGGRISRSA